jgi:hypothetical protein
LLDVNDDGMIPASEILSGLVQIGGPNDPSLFMLLCSLLMHCPQVPSVRLGAVQALIDVANRKRAKGDEVDYGEFVSGSVDSAVSCSLC